MVIRDSPVASATREIPPRPIARASAAAQSRRARSSRRGCECGVLRLDGLRQEVPHGVDRSGPNCEKDNLFWRNALAYRAVNTDSYG